MARTFKVTEKLPPPSGPRRSTEDVLRQINTQLGGRTSTYRPDSSKRKPPPFAPEAAAVSTTTLVVEGRVAHPLIGAVHASFSYHLPLVLAPDHLWLMIAQGFAQHVNADPEALRSKFVTHEGKKLINITRNDFIKGSADNNWPGVFAQFSGEIAKSIGEKKRDLVVPSFSTTGPVERVAAEVTLMDAMQNYFEYRVSTMCGIPEITLLGTPADWESVRTRAMALGEYGLEWWTKMLRPILDQFVDASKGRADKVFWESIYKEGGGSGGPYITGWVQLLFPYYENHQDNGRFTRRSPHFERWDWNSIRFGMCDGPCWSDLPSGLSKAPFEWLYYSEVFPMEFVAGFVGYSQDPDTLAVQPAVGWAVRDALPAAPVETPTVDRSFPCHKCKTTLSAKPPAQVGPDMPREAGEVEVKCSCGQTHYCSATEVSITTDSNF